MTRHVVKTIKAEQQYSDRWRINLFKIFIGDHKADMHGLKGSFRHNRSHRQKPLCNNNMHRLVMADKRKNIGNSLNKPESNTGNGAGNKRDDCHDEQNGNAIAMNSFCIWETSVSMAPVARDILKCRKG